MSSRISGRVCDSRPAHHEASAGDDAVAMRGDDATVDSATLAKIIRVDNQVFGGSSCRGMRVIIRLCQHSDDSAYKPASIITCRSSFSASKYSAAISLAA